MVHLSVKRFLFLVLAVFFSANACADIPGTTTTEMKYRAVNGVYSSVVSGWHSSKPAAAAELMGLLSAHMLTKDVACQLYQRSGTKYRDAQVKAYDASGINPATWDRFVITAPSNTCVDGPGARAGGYSISYNSEMQTETVCPANSSIGESGGCVCNAGFQENATHTACEPIPEPPDDCPAGTEKVDGQCVPKCKPDEHRVDGVCRKSGCPSGKPAGDFTTSSDSPTFLCAYYLPAWKYCGVYVADPGCVKYQSGGAWQQSCGGAGVWKGGACTPTQNPKPSTDPPGGDPSPGPGDPGDPGTPGTNPPTPSPTPTPTPTPPDNEGNCAPGTHKGADGKCYKDDQAPTEDPNKPGSTTCPEGMSKVFINGTATCVSAEYGGGGGGGGSSGGGTDPGTGGGTGGGSGNCVPGDNRVECATLDGEAEDNIGRVTKTVTWTPDYVLGSGGGSCPADQVVTIAGRSITLTDMAWACDKLSAYVRPMALLLATISAIFIVTGAAGGRPED